MADKTRGYYYKYTVFRNDESSEVGGKHHTCDYLVLDLDHRDNYIEAAVRAYAEACKDDYPILSEDLLKKLCE